MNDPQMLSEEAARRLDAEDPLARFRARFRIPAGTIYFDGNSLGLLGHESERSIARLLAEWRELAVRGWLDGQRPWFYLAEEIGAMAAELVGASPEELVLTGTTTSNIHALVSSFYRPAGRRTKILADALDFPSDIYALKSQVRLKGLDPARELKLVGSRDGRTIEEEDVIREMTDEVALVFLPSVLYRSGQLFDLERLAAEAFRRGIPIGFDCSHSAGAVPHDLSRWGVDFAVFCGYKYLNGGPGCPAFLFLHRRHFGREPALAGWFGSRKDRQFDMSHEFTPAPTAGGWQISSPGILGAAALEGSLAVIREAGIGPIREKSLRLTSFLIDLVQTRLAGRGFTVGSPLDPRRRGGHVAVEHPVEAVRIGSALRDRGVIPDVRPPNIIRLAPVALYNTFGEAWSAVRLIEEIVDGRAYEAYPRKRPAVS